MTLRVAILGTGRMGRQHAAAYTSLPDVEVAGIAGRDPERTRALADELGVEPFDDVWKLVEDPSVGAVDVCLPTALHRQYVVGALERGRPVFCEMPFAETLEDADAMIAAAEANDRFLGVANLVRFIAHPAHIIYTAREGDLGDAVMAMASRLSPPYRRPEAPDAPDHYGDPLTELAPFDLIYMHWLLGEPTSVFARGVPDGRGGVRSAQVSLGYEDGGMATVEVGETLPVGSEYLTDLHVVFGQGEMRSTMRAREGETPVFATRRINPDGTRRDIEVLGGNPYRAECERFAHCCIGEGEPEPISARTARKALRVALAARESLETGRPVGMGPAR